MLADHRGFDFTKRIVRPDGEIRRVRCVGIAVTPGGRFQGFVGTGMDVTEQEQLTEKLRRSEHYLQEREREFRQILDLTPQHLGVFGPDGSPLYANRVSLDYFGVTAAGTERRHSDAGRVFRATLRETGGQEHPLDRQEGAGSVAVLRLARQHS